MGRAARSRIVVGVFAAVVVVLGGGWAAAATGGTTARRAPTEGRGDDLYGCDRTLGHQPQGHLHKRTEPAGGSAVHPGDTVRVMLTWEQSDWSSGRLHKVLDCVAIDGRLVRSLQAGESPTDNDGRFTREFVVPHDARPGTEVCDQAMLSGPSPRGDYDRQISNQVCHPVKSQAGREGGGCDKCDRCTKCERACGDDNEGVRCGEKKDKEKKEGDDCTKTGGCQKSGDCKKAGGDEGEKSGDCARKSRDDTDKCSDDDQACEDCGCKKPRKGSGRVSKLLDSLLPGSSPKAADSPLVVPVPLTASPPSPAPVISSGLLAG
jgi:hypothetical protein